MKARWFLVLFLLIGLPSLWVTSQATVNEVTPASNRALGDGTTTAFSYTFKIYAKTDIEVLVDSVTKTVDTDYTVSGLGNSGGGTVTFLSAPANAAVVTIIRKQPFQQTSVYTLNEPFPSTRVEKDLDKLVMAAQQLKEALSRALQFAKQSTTTANTVDDPTTGKFLRSKAGGGFDWATPTNAGALSSPVAVADGGTGSTTAIGARTNLQVPGYTSNPTINAKGDLLPGTADDTYTRLAVGADGSILTADSGQSTGMKWNALGAVGTTPRVSSSTAWAYGAPAGYLWGLTLSNNGSDATNDIDISVGEAASSSTTFANRAVLALTSGLTKRLDATWATGTNQGGRSSSVSLSNTTYHVCLIRVSGVDDVGFDTSATCANLITDHSATHVRRIGSILRESAAIVAFVQDGDLFQRTATVRSINATNPGTSAVTATIHVPIGINVRAKIRGTLLIGSSGSAMVVSDLAASDEAAPAVNSTAAPGANVVSNVSSGMNSSEFFVRTNTSAQVRYRLSVSDANVIAALVTMGWMDTRGQVN